MHSASDCKLAKVKSTQYVCGHGDEDVRLLLVFLEVGRRLDE